GTPAVPRRRLLGRSRCPADGPPAGHRRRRNLDRAAHPVRRDPRGDHPPAGRRRGGGTGGLGGAPDPAAHRRRDREQVMAPALRVRHSFTPALGLPALSRPTALPLHPAHCGHRLPDDPSSPAPLTRLPAPSPSATYVSTALVSSAVHPANAPLLPPRD